MGAAIALGLFRLLLLVVVSLLSFVPLGMIGDFPARGIVMVSITVALVYWALMDVVQIWRIAAYVSLAEYEPEVPVTTVPVLAPELRGPDVSAPELPENPAPEASL
jgi:hypothetical protein